MKLLYGVQGTGNGHLTRARALVPAMRAAGIDVDILISGRAQSALFGTEVLGPSQWRRGLSFVMEKGNLRPLKTIVALPLRQCFHDIRHLDLSAYDRVLTDFEPVTAWAARLQRVSSVAIGHQYAFRQRVPTRGINIPSRMVLRHFAPADICVGLHWHHFNTNVLPPMLEPLQSGATMQDNKVLVYLPFDDNQALEKVLRPFSNHQFYIYCDIKSPVDHGHLHWRPFSRDGFRADLNDCATVLTGAGFELPSEALVLGKRLLVRPLHAQFEQESNAEALRQMQRAVVMQRLSGEKIAETLAQPQPEPVHYPDVVTPFAQWLKEARAEQLPALARSLWQQTKGLPATTPTGQNLAGRESACDDSIVSL